MKSCVTHHHVQEPKAQCGCARAAVWAVGAGCAIDGAAACAAGWGERRGAAGWAGPATPGWAHAPRPRAHLGQPLLTLFEVSLTSRYFNVLIHIGTFAPSYLLNFYQWCEPCAVVSQAMMSGVCLHSPGVEIQTVFEGLQGGLNP